VASIPAKLVVGELQQSWAVSGDKINLGDPITHQDAKGHQINGWRHAGCIGPQVRETLYKQAEKALKRFLGRSEGP